jgi:dTDP-4-amino-4,6-dideoxygalactose transaminase
LQPAYADLGYGPGRFPVSEKAAREVLSLPMYPELTSRQIASVAEACVATTTAFTRSL